MAVDGRSSDIQKKQIDKLEKLFPEVVSEGRVDFAKLRATLGESVDMSERYTLSWKGKKDVFAAIQERTTKTLKPSREESVDYDTTENLLIEGDNLEVLKVLQDSYYGKIKMIYIDPPYNTGNDFVYNDKFAEKRAEYEEAQNGTRSDGLMKNTKDKGYYHSNWLNMMYPRLFVARNLLRKDGVIFISIDDNEVHNLRLIMNEIFGEENFVGEYIWYKKVTGGYDNENINMQHEYILVFCKRYSGDLLYGEKKESKYKLVDEHGRRYKWDSLWNVGGLQYSKGLDYPIIAPDGSEVWPLGERGVAFWLWSKSKVEQNMDKLKFEQKADGSWRIYKRIYASDEIVSGSILDKNIVKGNTYSSREIKNLFDDLKLFDYAKPTTLLAYLVERSAKNDDIVLDFFSGSGTTAHAVMQLNAEDGGSRKHIQVQLPELTDEKSEAYKAGYKTIADIAKERIRRAGKKILEESTDKLKERKSPLDIGFKVLKLDDSNFKAWNTDIEDEEQLKEQMQAHLDPIVDGAREEDLLLELMLKSGYRPTDKVEQRDGYWLVSNTDVGKTAISLVREITEELYARILATKPTKILLLDRSLTSSSLKTNLLLQAKHANIDLEVV